MLRYGDPLDHGVPVGGVEVRMPIAPNAKRKLA
jgi:hypothetical protein